MLNSNRNKKLTLVYESIWPACVLLYFRGRSSAVTSCGVGWGFAGTGAWVGFGVNLGTWGAMVIDFWVGADWTIIGFTWGVDFADAGVGVGTGLETTGLGASTTCVAADLFFFRFRFFFLPVEESFESPVAGGADSGTAAAAGAGECMGFRSTVVHSASSSDWRQLLWINFKFVTKSRLKHSKRSKITNYDWKFKCKK